MGPMGDLLEPLGRIGIKEAKIEFQKIAQCAISCKDTFDLYSLETFSNLDELQAAISGIREVDATHPILASIYAKSTQTDFLDSFISKIASREDVQFLGLNCSEGPSDILRSLQYIRPLTEKPIIVQPNAGIPRAINGRYFYMTSPDYLAKYSKRFVEAGAQGVGGCCGTGPSHILAIKKSFEALEVKQNVIHSPLQKTNISIKEPRTPIEKRIQSRIGQLLAQNKKVYSIELIPPKGTDVTKFLGHLDEIEKAGVDFINIPDGARASTRISSLHLASLIAHQNRKLSAIPHFTTRDRNLIALQSDLLGASVNGVKDVLLITGDPPKLGTNRDATAVYDIDSIGLTYLVDCLNRGFSPTGDSLGKGTAFGIGVATNPTAINLELEYERWIYKCESGADFAITQPIFDPESYFKWRDKVGPAYKPHFVGIWPLVSLRNAEFMANEVPGVHVPNWVLERMSQAENNPEESIKIGIEIAKKVMQGLEKSCEGFVISAPLGKLPVALETLK
jgi:homocysteine S-methyltransferase